MAQSLNKTDAAKIRKTYLNRLFNDVAVIALPFASGPLIFLLTGIFYSGNQITDFLNLLIDNRVKSILSIEKTTLFLLGIAGQSTLIFGVIYKIMKQKLEMVMAVGDLVQKGEKFQVVTLDQLLHLYFEQGGNEKTEASGTSSESEEQLHAANPFGCLLAPVYLLVGFIFEIVGFIFAILFNYVIRPLSLVICFFIIVPLCKVFVLIFKTAFTFMMGRFILPIHYNYNYSKVRSYKSLIANWRSRSTKTNKVPSISKEITKKLVWPTFFLIYISLTIFLNFSLLVHYLEVNFWIIWAYLSTIILIFTITKICSLFAKLMKIKSLLHQYRLAQEVEAPT